MSLAQTGIMIVGGKPELAVLAEPFYPLLGFLSWPSYVGNLSAPGHTTVAAVSRDNVTRRFPPPWYVEEMQGF